MKYEMIFGDEALFDGAPDDAEYAGWFCQETRWYMILNGKILFSDGGIWCTSDNPYLSADIAAMRRIIKEPKRWTWEDKKAGRAPEVGSIFTYRDETLTCHFIDGDGEIWAHDIDNKIVTPLLRDCKPIETPAEKAQREEDEFVNFVLHHSESKINSSEELVAAKRAIKLAYKLQLSGELVAPKVGER